MKNNQKSYAKYEVKQRRHGNMKENNKLRFSLPSKLIWIISKEERKAKRKGRQSR